MTNKISGKSRRYLALWFPRLPADRHRRSCPCETSADPVVFTEKIKGAVRLAALDRRALKLGLRAGLTLADARARVPGLRAAETDEAADRAFLETIADLCDRYTPLVALEGPAGLVLDITGCTHLFGGEAPLRAELIARLAAAGMEVQASIADTPQGAFAFARFGDHGIVAPQMQAQIAAKLPLAALDLEVETLVALARAGLKTIGDLAARPRDILAARFGETLLFRLDTLRGAIDTRITPRRPLPACMAERRFGEPVATLDAAFDTLSSLAGQIGRSLETRGEGARRFEASFYRTDGKTIRLAVATGRAVRDANLVMRLFRERMDALADPLDPGFGFDMIRLGASGCEPFAVAQPDLDSRLQEEEEVAALLDRLAARFGQDAVLRFVTANTHIPERAGRLAAAGAGAERAIWPQPMAHEPPTRPLTLFAPPQPIETAHEVPEGPPRQFRWRRVLHRVVKAEGPERIADEWWRQEPARPVRDYYRIEDTQGHRFWVFREGLYGETDRQPRWFLHGTFA